MIIDITKGIKVGGFDYTVDMSRDGHRRILANAHVGECDHLNRILSVDCDVSAAYASEAFIHEIIEAVNNVYCSDEIDHAKITQLAYGLHQVMESLNVRFGVAEK